MGEKGLKKYGTGLLIQRHQAIVHERMKQLIGQKGVNELAKAPDQIVLADIEASLNTNKWEFAAKCFVYTLGTAAMFALCVYSGELLYLSPLYSALLPLH
jgi:hypothetical protein